MAWTRHQYEFTRSCIRSRRQRRKMAAAGYYEIDPTRCGWTMFNELRQRGDTIAAVEIGTGGDTLFVKLASPLTNPPGAPPPVSGNPD